MQKSISFGDFGVSKPTFDVWREDANLGLLLRAKFCKNRLRGLAH